MNIAASNFFLDRVPEAEKQSAQLLSANERRPIYCCFSTTSRSSRETRREWIEQRLGEGKPGVEDWMLHSQALVEARLGRVQAATTLSRRAVDLAQQAGQKEGAASYQVAQAVWHKLCSGMQPWQGGARLRH